MGFSLGEAFAAIGIKYQSQGAVEEFKGDIRALSGLMSTLRSSSTASTESIAMSFAKLPFEVLSATNAVGAFVAVMGTLETAIIGSQAVLRNWTFEIRDFANATGVGAEGAGIFAAAAKAVGGSAKEYGLSFAIMLQMLDQAQVKADASASQLAEKYSDLAVKLNDVKADHISQLAEYSADAAEQAASLKQNWDRFLEDFNTESFRRVDDYNRERIDADKNRDKSLEDAKKDHNETITDLEKDLSDAQIAYTEASADKQIDLQEKLYAIEEEYSNKRLGLWNSYFNANPLLRPFIKTQIGLLDSLQQGEENLTTDKYQREIQKIKRSYDDQVVALELKISRENADYEKQTQKIISQHDDRLSDLQRSYDRANEDAAKSYNREYNDYKAAQDKMSAAFDERIAKENLQYDRQIRDLEDRFNDLATSTSSGGQAFQTNWGVARALKEVNIDLGELISKFRAGGQETFDAYIELFKAYSAIPSDVGKTQFMQEAGGFFGVMLKPIFDFLGTGGADKFKELYANIIPTQEQQDRLERIQYSWNQVGLIFDDIVMAFAKDLVGNSESLANALNDLWADPDKRKAVLDTVHDIATSISSVFTTLQNLIEGKVTLEEVFDKLLPENSMTTGGNFGTRLGEWLSGVIADVLLGLAGDTKNRDTIRAASEDFAGEFLAGFLDGFSKHSDLIAKAWNQLVAEWKIAVIEGAYSGDMIDKALMQLMGLGDQDLAVLAQQTGYATTTYKEYLDGLRAISYKNAQGIQVDTQASWSQIQEIVASGTTVILRDTGDKLTSLADMNKDKYKQINEETRIANEARLAENQKQYEQQQADWDALHGHMATIASTRYATIRDDATGAIGHVIQYLDENGNVLSSKLIDPIEEAKKQDDLEMKALQKGITGTVDSLKTDLNAKGPATTLALTSPITEAQKTITDQKDQFKSLGGDLAGGFASGWLEIMKNFIIKGIPNTLLDMINEARRVTDTHSDSKLWYTFGADIGGGYISGFMNTLKVNTPLLSLALSPSNIPVSSNDQAQTINNTTNESPIYINQLTIQSNDPNDMMAKIKARGVNTR